MVRRLDLPPEARPPPDPVKPRAVENGQPRQGEMLARGLLGVPRYPVRLLRSLPATIPNVDEVPAIFGGIPGAGTIGRIAGRVTGASRGRNTLQAPKTKFNGRISPHRRFAFGQLSLDEVKQVKKARGVTVNDVVVSICAGAVRRWLVKHEDLPDEPLVAQIPVSVRTDEQVGTYGNRIMLMSAPLFSDEPDPLKRLEETHGAMVDMKERHKALPASLLQNANELIPPALV